MADIELVIKISEKLACEGFERSFTEEEKSVLIRAIGNGIPLPKGHGRLIDADKTISNICGSSCGCHLEECGYDEHCFSVTRIESAPTIIEADKAESEDKENGICSL